MSCNYNGKCRCKTARPTGKNYHTMPANLFQMQSWVLFVPLFLFLAFNVLMGAHEIGVGAGHQRIELKYHGSINTLF